MDALNPLDPLDPNVPSRHPTSKHQTSEKALPTQPGTAGENKMENENIFSTPKGESPAHVSRPSIAGQGSFSRQSSKRFFVGSKVVKIALPLENEFGRKTNRERYLTSEEVEQRLQEWKGKGFDISPFGLAPPSTSLAFHESEGHSRPIHPDPAEERVPRSERQYRVSIPDRREWEAYVNFLKEEKLRALGVSFGEDEQPNHKSPAPSLMSRGASSQGSSMLMSPLLAPTQTGGMPSQATFQNLPHANGQPPKLGVSHFPRFSVAQPFGEKNFPSIPQLPPTQSPVHGIWSPQQYNSSQPGSRVASPATANNVTNNGISVSASPQHPMHFHQMGPRDSNDAVSAMRQQQPHQQVQHTHQQQPSPVLLPRAKPSAMQLDQEEAGPRTSQSPTEPAILTPVPRGHRQNPSESLQREVEEAEALLEANEREEGSSAGASKEDVPRKTTTDVRAPREAEQGTAISKDHSEVSTSTESQSEKNQPSTAGTKSKHASKPSFSKLNVNAPEFKFAPQESAAPGPTSSSSEDQAQESVPPGFEFIEQPSNHAKKPSLGPNKMSRLNVAAPVFTPQSAPKPSIPSGEFSFLATGPSFNPGAPAFKPHGPAPGPYGVNAPPIDPAGGMKKIFGEVRLPEVVKPAKQSQALPIIKPDRVAAGQIKDDLMDDEHGRLIAADGRQKRARRGQDDGDEVPQFASASEAPWLGDSQDDRAAYFGNDPSSSSETEPPKELKAAKDMLKEIINEMSQSEKSSMRSETRHSPHRPKPELHPPHHEPGHVSSDPFRHSEHRLERDTDGDPHHNTTTKERSLSSASESGSAHSTSFVGRRHKQDYAHDAIDRVDHATHGLPIRRDILDGARYVDPSYHEIDEVMKHMNEDSDLGVERQPSPWEHNNPSRSPRQTSLPGLKGSPIKPNLLSHPHFRSGAPSPSPNRLNEPFQYLPPTDSESADTAAREMVARNARFSPSYRPSRNDPHVQRLNSPGSTPPSDWNDALSDADEEKFASRVAFFDHRVDDLVGDIVRRRLGPIEKSLSGIQDSIAKLSSRSQSRRPRSSGTMDIENSDADDEDDEQEPEERAQSRLKSPFRDRRFDQLKTSISEMAAAQQKFVPNNQVAEMMDALKEMKSAMQDAPRGGGTPSGDLKAIVEEAVGRQMRGRSAPVTSASQAAAAEKSALQIAGLESMLKVAENRAEEELKARRATEDAFADNQRLLRQALHEASEQKESAEATERSLQDYHGDQQQLLRRMATLEGSQDHLEKLASDLTEKNAALEGTLQEYRLSSDKWRTDIDDAKHENKELKRQINSTHAENEGLTRERHLLRVKFDQMQESVHSSAREFATDQSRWQSVEDSHKNKLEMLSARLEAEARTRERLELEIERLEGQEKESMKARFQMEQTLKANSHLDKLVGQLRSEGHDHQNKATSLEQDLRAAKDNHSMELHRTRSDTKIQVDEVKAQANVVRNELQTAITRLEKRLQDSVAETDGLKSRHESTLQELSQSHTTALREASQAKEAALQERSDLHERSLNDTKAQHKHALENALADKERSETYFSNRLNLADEKIVHYQDRIVHLEEKVEIAREAANAAVQAAQAKNSDSPIAFKTPLTPLPERISPQALRESIMVLQEQLQAREGHIEELESQLSEIDSTAPTKLKDAEIEITWLRELLSVRIDDLEDIITRLSRPTYDRSAVKDAAIRLKANLQMEQQEKERALAGTGQPLTLSSISNLAASPRALPMAAAAAWGNWRRGRESSLLGNVAANPSDSVQLTPSKSRAPQSLFAGLMTPPSTDVKTPPQPLLGGSSSRPTSSSNSKRIATRADPATLKRSASSQVGNKTELRRSSNEGASSGAPVTPPFNLMRNASYDMDAREGPGFDDFADAADTGDAEGFDQAKYEVGSDEGEPFGPEIGTFS